MPCSSSSSGDAVCGLFLYTFIRAAGGFYHYMSEVHEALQTPSFRFRYDEMLSAMRVVEQLDATTYVARYDHDNEQCYKETLCWPERASSMRRCPPHTSCRGFGSSRRAGSSSGGELDTLRIRSVYRNHGEHKMIDALSVDELIFDLLKQYYCYLMYFHFICFVRVPERRGGALNSW